eukprot:PhM_4_TR4266/c0_g1_i1/m.13520
MSNNNNSNARGYVRPITERVFLDLRRNNTDQVWGITMVEDSWKVHIIRDGTIAQRCGLRAGDSILSVNGVAVNSPSAPDVMRQNLVVRLEVDRTRVPNQQQQQLQPHTPQQQQPQQPRHHTPSPHNDPRNSNTSTSNNTPRHAPLPSPTKQQHQARPQPTAQLVPARLTPTQQRQQQQQHQHQQQPQRLPQQQQHQQHHHHHHQHHQQQQPHRPMLIGIVADEEYRRRKHVETESMERSLLLRAYNTPPMKSAATRRKEKRERVDEELTALSVPRAAEAKACMDTIEALFGAQPPHSNFLAMIQAREHVKA